MNMDDIFSQFGDIFGGGGGGFSGFGGGGGQRRVKGVICVFVSNLLWKKLLMALKRK